MIKRNINLWRTVPAYLLLTVISVLFVLGVVGLWFWGMALTVLVLSPDSFTYLEFAKGLVSLLILVCPALVLVAVGLNDILNHVFDEEDFDLFERKRGFRL